MMKNQRSYWGWGNADFRLPQKMFEHTKMMLKGMLQIEEFEQNEPKAIEELQLRTPRFNLPAPLKSICSAYNFDRASHAYGKAFRDVWRGLHGYFPNPPDYVAFPKTEEDIMQLMDFANENQVSVIPVGGGSSVCGGIEPTENNLYAGVISINMKYFSKIIEIDKTSRAAHIQAGIYGPALEKELKQHDLTLRHYPQSFEFSTLGGWIATRSGGHFATLYTHIDEFVQSINMVTPMGTKAYSALLLLPGCAYKIFRSIRKR